MLRAGIVGLPNVGVVTVPDERLQWLSEMSKTKKIIPTVIEMVDIAGLVKGASQGEGLGNQFLTHIREVDAIVQVVRCFEDENIHHVSGSIDPLRDIEVVNTELVLSDLAAVQKRIDKTQKGARGGDKEAKAELALLERLLPHLDSGKPALLLQVNEEEKPLLKNFCLLTTKPTLFACNVAEADLAKGESHPLVQRVKAYAKEHHATEAVIISAQIESDLIDLSDTEAVDYLKELGVSESGVGALIRATYHLLGLRTYFTTGEKETRAWTILTGDTAPQAAGVIHSDFERGFIAAECVAYDELKRLGSMAKAKEAGKWRIEGKEYLVADGDVLEFRFNV